MQEIQIYSNENTLLFTGYLESYKMPELTMLNSIENELTLTLMTPRTMATKKTVTIVTTDTLLNIINKIFQPLYNDGFVLKEHNFDNKAITVKLIARIIEECMQILSTNYSLYWNINELKEITVNSIEYQFNKPFTKSININNYKKELKGFLKLVPSVEGTDYANIINVKNARVFYSFLTNNINLVMKQNDKYEFENPIDISFDTAKRLNASSFVDGATIVVNNLKITYSDNKEAYIISGINMGTGAELVDGSNIKDIGTDSQKDSLFVLNMDGTFKNLATGFTYQGENEITLNEIWSETALRYASIKLLNWQEIEKNAGTITKTGQIEKTIDANAKWFTMQELITYIRGHFVSNDKNTNIVKLYLDEDNNINIGDRLEIDLQELYTRGNYIVTDITLSKEWNNPYEYIIELRNTGLLENYANLFQDSLSTEEQANQTDVEYVVEYAEEETIVETNYYKTNETYTENTIINDYVYDTALIEYPELSEFAGRQITGIGFGSYNYDKEEYVLYAFLDVSKYQIIVQEGQTITISRKDKITSDLLFSSPFSTVEYPTHLTMRGILELEEMEYNEIFSQLYSVAFGTLYNKIDTEEIPVADLDFKKEGLGTVTLIGAQNYAIYPSMDLFPNEGLFPGRNTVGLKNLEVPDRGIGQYPSNNLFPSISLYPKQITPKYVIYKFKLYRRRWEDIQEIIEDTGLYYYQAQKIDGTGAIKLTIKYERG